MRLHPLVGLLGTSALILLAFHLFDGNLFSGNTRTFTLRPEETKEVLDTRVTLREIGIQGPVPGKAVGTVSYQGAVVTVQKGMEKVDFGLKTGESKSFKLGGIDYTLLVVKGNPFEETAELRLSRA